MEKKNPLSESWEGAAWVGFWAWLLAMLAVQNPFVLDDLSKIVGNPDIRSFSNVFSKLVYPYSEFQVLERNDPSRPLVFLVYSFLYSVGGPFPFLFHLFNGFVHAANVALLFVLSGRLVRSFSLGAEAERWVPWLVALLFAVVPIQVGTVAYIYGLSDILSALFVLGFVVLITGRQDSKSSRWALVCYLAALASKQSAVVAPVLAWIWLKFVPAENSGQKESALRRISGSLWITVVYLGARFLYFGSIGDLEGRGNTLPFWDYVSLQPWVWLRYLRLSLIPYGLSLDHYLGPKHVSWEARVVAGAIWAALVYFVVRAWRLRREPIPALLFFCLLWYAICLAPTSSILPTVDLLVERRVYLANFGLFLACTILVPKRVFWKSAIAIALLGYVGISMFRNFEQRTTEGIWKSVLNVYPNSPRALNNLGTWYLDHQRYAEARVYLGRALELNPEDPFAMSNMGSYFQEERNPEFDSDRAVAYFQQAIAIRSEMSESHYNLGRLFQVRNKSDQAEEEYRISLRIRPNYAPALNNLGVLFLRRNQIEEARKYFDQALLADPSYAPAIANFADVNPQNGGYRPQVKEIPVSDMPAHIVVETYRSHLKKHPQDEQARKKFREFCRARRIVCDP